MQRPRLPISGISAETRTQGALDLAESHCSTKRPSTGSAVLARQRTAPRALPAAAAGKHGGAAHALLYSSPLRRQAWRGPGLIRCASSQPTVPVAPRPCLCAHAQAAGSRPWPWCCTAQRRCRCRRWRSSYRRLWWLRDVVRMRGRSRACGRWCRSPPKRLSLLQVSPARCRLPGRGTTRADNMCDCHHAGARTALKHRAQGVVDDCPSAVVTSVDPRLRSLCCAGQVAGGGLFLLGHG